MFDLPDNWLTEFPLSMLPDSWALNAMYIRKLEELQIMWDEHGYSWKFGSELEFTLLSPEGAEEKAGIARNKNLSHLHPEYKLLDESRQCALNAATQPDMFLYALEQIRDSFSGNPDTDRLLEESKWTHEDALKHLADIERNLYSEKPDIVHRSRQNIFLAYLHTRNFSEGGLMDLVEARFGDHELGLGWYDMAGPEIRTKILTSSLAVIEHYHKFLHILSTQAPRFGLVLDITNSSPPQFHASLWRKSDQKNMMLMDDEDSKVFCEHALRGYYEFLNTAPFMIQDCDYRQEYISIEFSAGSTRYNFVRQESDNWEIRRMQYHAITHAARHLSMLMMGMAYGCMYESEYEKFSKEQVFLGLRRTEHPMVRHRYGMHVSGMVCVLEHSSILEDGWLEPDITMIGNYIDRLKEEVGYNNLKEFTVCTDKNPDCKFDLRHQSTWEVLLKRCRITEDNELDMSFLGEDSEIAEAFQAVEITGRRTILQSDYDHLQTEAHAMKHMLETFMGSKSAQIFFTPAEQSALREHYTRQSQSILYERAVYDVHQFEAIYDNPQNKTFSDEEIALGFLEQIYLTPTCNLDINQTFLMQLLILVTRPEKLERPILFDMSSYVLSMRPHFKAAAEKRIELLAQNPIANESMIGRLKTCIERVMNKPFAFHAPIWVEMETIFGTIADGSGIKKTGLSEDFARVLYFVPAVCILRNLGLALYDDTYTDQDILREAEELFRQAPSRVEEFERNFKLNKKDEMTRLIFKGCKDHFLQTVREVRDWASITMGHGLSNQLPTPSYQVKRNGPEQWSGPA